MAAKLATAANLDTRYLPKLAVLPFDIPASVNLQDAETLAQLLATELANSRKYAVLPRTRTIEAAMAEQDIQRSGLTDPNSIKAIGKATNADYVLTGTVTNLGSLNLFVAQILNVEDGSMLTGDDREYQTITDGLTLMPQMSDKLTGLQDERERARIAELARQQQQEAERQRQEAERQAQAEQQRLAEQQWLETERQRVAQEAADSAAKQVAWKSQWLYLGVRGGMSIRSYTMSQKSELASADLTFTEGFVGFEGSLQIALQLLPINNLASFALQTELIIASDKLAFKSSTKTASGRFLTGSFEFSALQVPLMVKFSYRPANFLLAGFAGVYLTIPTSDMQVTLKGTLNDGSTNSSYSAPLGIVFGANAGLKLGPGALFADLRGAIDTGDTVHKNDTPLFHRVALSLSLGYEIGLFNRRKN
jgi:TolB-like protein